MLKVQVAEVPFRILNPVYNQLYTPVSLLKYSRVQIMTCFFFCRVVYKSKLDLVLDNSESTKGATSSVIFSV